MGLTERECCVRDWIFVDQDLDKRWDLRNAEMNVWVL